VWGTRSWSLSKHFRYTLYTYHNHTSNPNSNRWSRTLIWTKSVQPDGSTGTGHDNARQHSLQRPPIVVVWGEDDHKTETVFNDTDPHGIYLIQAVKSFEFQEEDRGSIPGQSVWDADKVVPGLVLFLEPDFPWKVHKHTCSVLNYYCPKCGGYGVAIPSEWHKNFSKTSHIHMTAIQPTAIPAP